jgi:dihydropteroate synthase
LLAPPGYNAVVSVPFQWDMSRTLIMGILNVTPDSFFDGGKFFDLERATEHARALHEAGADILDVGGESTRPGAAPVSATEQLRRVLPVVQALTALTVSVDTTSAAVADAALAAGARIVNDISALRADPGMPEVVRRHRAGVVLMHMQGTPQTMQQHPRYTDVVVEVAEFLRERVAFAESHGLARQQIAVDPGIGFGKTVEHNLQLLANLDRLRLPGCPLLVGTSRKSFIGKLLGRDPQQRLAGTAATLAWAVAQGANIVRVHDVAEMRDVTRIVEALRRARAGRGPLDS